MIKIQDYLDGEAGVDLLEAALARILDEELDLLPSWKVKVNSQRMKSAKLYITTYLYPLQNWTRA